MQSRYRRYDGHQDPLGDHVDLGDVLEQIGDDMLQGLGGQQALRRLLQRGMPGRTGLEGMRERLQAAREALREQADAAGALDRAAAALDDIVATERAALAAADDDAARFQELVLDALPSDPGGRIRELRDYDFASPEAQAQFDALLDQLRAEVLDSYVKDVSGALDSVTPEDIARLVAMFADLNAMLEARERGEEPDFGAFMATHGELFPEQPQTLDELLEVLARRMAAMSRLMASLTPDQRAQLAELARSVFDDLDLQFQLSQLGENLRGVMPQLPWDDPEGYGLGDQSMPLSAAVDAMERLGELEELEDALAGDYPGATLEDIDEDALRRALGDDAVGDLEALKRIERALEESGVVQRRAGELELTPRGARLMGERALTSLLDRIRKQPATRAVGSDAELTHQTRPWEFGDREPLAVRRTIHNAVLREAAEGRGDGSGVVRLKAEDFEVAETEVRPRTATALLLDLSFSMPLQGHFVPAKKMALALHALIEGKHRQDSLHLIGFSDYARRLKPADLGAPGFERVYGTNMHHAFLLARRELARDPRPVKQVIMVTDGEPTAHLEDGQSVFNWPPVSRTLETTLREAMRLARAGISLNIFLLEDAPGLVAFARRLAHVTGGQVFQMGAEEMGRFVIGGYRTAG